VRQNAVDKSAKMLSGTLPLERPLHKKLPHEKLPHERLLHGRLLYEKTLIASNKID
jgi:hypothetical protein